jgi:hypothetical protein
LFVREKRITVSFGLRVITTSFVDQALAEWDAMRCLPQICDNGSNSMFKGLLCFGVSISFANLQSLNSFDEIIGEFLKRI